MALVDPEELKVSREAREAGVDSVGDDDATQAIEDAELALYAALGYRVEESSVALTLRGTGEDVLVLPQHAQSVSAVTSDGVEVSSDAYDARSGWTIDGRLWTGKEIVIAGTFGYPEESDTYKRAKRAVIKLAVRYLQSSKVAPGAPNSSGAYVTSYTSQQASFTYFTPSGDLTGYQDIDRLIEQIGRHPFKGNKKLRAVPLG